MFDLLNESPAPLHAAARAHPGFRHLSGKSLTRYPLRGVLKDAARVKLEVVRVGGRLLTSQAALTRFIEALNDAPPALPAPRSPSARLRASERAGEERDRRMSGA